MNALTKLAKIYKEKMTESNEPLNESALRVKHASTSANATAPMRHRAKPWTHKSQKRNNSSCNIPLINNLAIVVYQANETAPILQWLQSLNPETKIEPEQSDSEDSKYNKTECFQLYYSLHWGYIILQNTPR